MTSASLPIIVAFAVSAAGGEALRRFSINHSLVDRPNERSLHQIPVPRVGGVALVGGVAVGALVARPIGSTLITLALGGGVAALGAVDDLRPLPPSLRFPVHLALAVAFVALCGPAIIPWLAPTLAATVTAIALAGLLNVYNFMDGMDGLAGSQAVFAGAVQAMLFHSVAFDDGAIIAACVAAASAGFVVHNFPPARMFMGDAGATSLGFTFAALAALGSRHGVPMTLSLLPLAPFLLDGAFTLTRRALRKEKVWRAHRSHLYQRAVQTGLTHGRVLWVYIVWLVVCAFATLLERKAMLTGWALALFGLLAIISWVRRLEASKRAGVA